MYTSIKYKRLISFGCSHTYGHGLEDCWVPKPRTEKTSGPIPSKFAWPQLLSDKLNIENLNLSGPGMSNKEIWWKILNTPLKEDDLVIIQWSFIDRTCIIKHDHTFRLAYWSTDKYSKQFFKYIHDKYDMFIDSVLRMNHIDMYLKEKNILSYHCKQPIAFDDYLPSIKWNTVNFLDIDFHTIRNQYPAALDGAHPGPLAHIEIADSIYNQIISDIIE